jgi:hypothetical protein
MHEPHSPPCNIILCRGLQVSYFLSLQTLSAVKHAESSEKVACASRPAMLTYLSYQPKAENFDSYSSGKQILSFYGIRMFINAFKEVDSGTSHLNQSRSSHPIPQRSILILSCYLNVWNFLTSWISARFEDCFRLLVRQVTRS